MKYVLKVLQNIVSDTLEFVFGIGNWEYYKKDLPGYDDWGRTYEIDSYMRRNKWTGNEYLYYRRWSGHFGGWIEEWILWKE